MLCLRSLPKLKPATTAGATYGNPDHCAIAMPTSKSGLTDKVTYQMLSEVFWTVLRMVTRASLVPTWRASSLTGLSRDCPAKAVEAHAVAAAIAANRNATEGERWERSMKQNCGCLSKSMLFVPRFWVHTIP